MVGLGLNPPLVAVDLGDARKAPHPGSERLQTITFVGSAGIGFGKLTGPSLIHNVPCRVKLPMTCSPESGS